jgi:hypothetical protein
MDKKHESLNAERQTLNKKHSTQRMNQETRQQVQTTSIRLLMNLVEGIYHKHNTLHAQHLTLYTTE